MNRSSEFRHVLPDCPRQHGNSILPRNRALSAATAHLARLGELVLGAAGWSLSPNRAVLGENVFRHESGIHRAGQEKNGGAYQPFEPIAVGHKRDEIVVGKRAGRATLRAAFRGLGVDPSTLNLEAILNQVRTHCRAHKHTVDSKQLLAFSGYVGR